MKRNHIIAFSLTAIIFLVGITTGWLISRSKVIYLEGLVNQIHRKMGDIELSFLLIDTFKENITCGFLLNEFNTILREDDVLRQKLGVYEQATNIDSKETLIDLKKDYTLTLLRYWLFVMKLRSICKTNFTTVLYFFSEDCKECPMQGFYLSYYKRKEKNKIMVFAVQSDIGLPIVDSLVLNFNITDHPTLLINEEHKYVGLKEKSELLKILCSHDQFLNFCNRTIIKNETISLSDIYINQSSPH